MKVARITKFLYRVYWKGRSKDVFLNSLGAIIEPVNPYNTLTPTEQQRVEEEIEKNFKTDFKK